MLAPAAVEEERHAAASQAGLEEELAPAPAAVVAAKRKDERRAAAGLAGLEEVLALSQAPVVATEQEVIAEEHEEERQATAGAPAEHKAGHAALEGELVPAPAAVEEEYHAAAGQAGLEEELAPAANVAAEREEERRAAAGALAEHKAGHAVLEGELAPT